MRPGEDPLTLTARAYPADQDSDAIFKWSTPDSDCLKLTPSEDGRSCECEGLKAKAGGTLLTVSCEGIEYSIPVYIVN